jgi:hypothetical protein
MRPLATKSSPRPRPGRAATLISRILAAGDATHEDIARELSVTGETLDAYLAGREPLPLDRQSGLALFVIANLPAFLAQGHRLRQQVAAAIAYESGQTRTHNAVPASTHWLRSPRVPRHPGE